MVRQGVERIAQKFQFEMVRRVGLEPTRRETPAPKAGASASSATGALRQATCQIGKASIVGRSLAKCFACRSHVR